MKIKLTNPHHYPKFTGVSKRFKDMTKQEIYATTYYPEIFNESDVFIDVENPNGGMNYLAEFEYEIINEGDLIMTTLQIPVKFNSGDKVYTIKQVKIENECLVCEGAGKIQYNNKYMKCPECMGMGKVKSNKQKYVVCDEEYIISSLKISYHKENMFTVKYKCGTTLESLNRSEENLFTTKEEAQAKCDDLNKERIVVKIQDIIIPNSFSRNIPSSEKIQKKLEYYKTNKRFDSDIFVNQHNIIQDGYINYLICKMLDIEDVKVVVKTSNNTSEDVDSYDSDDWLN